MSESTIRKFPADLGLKEVIAATLLTGVAGQAAFAATEPTFKYDVGRADAAKGESMSLDDLLVSLERARGTVKKATDFDPTQVHAIIANRDRRDHGPQA